MRELHVNAVKGAFRIVHWAVDPFSTAVQFTGWRESEDTLLVTRAPETYAPLVVYFPKTWLLSEGWRKHGTVSFYEVPSAPRT
jgi:hypothetical protein